MLTGMVLPLKRPSLKAVEPRRTPREEEAHRKEVERLFGPIQRKAARKQALIDEKSAQVTALRKSCSTLERWLTRQRKALGLPEATSLAGLGDAIKKMISRQSALEKDIAALVAGLEALQGACPDKHHPAYIQAQRLITRHARS